MTNGLPDFVVIGAQKSGTTTLAHRLAADPAVQVPEAELHYFAHRYDRGIEWYLQALGGGTPGMLLGEKSPSYLTDTEAAGRIIATVPDARLVAVLRDPVDRAYSHYWHNRRLDKEELAFAKAIEAEDARIEGAPAQRRARYGYVHGGRYETHLARFLPHFADRLHLALFEDLMADQEAVVQDIRTFLGLAGVAPADASAPVVSNAYVEYRSQRARRLARHLPRPLAGAVFKLNRREATYAPLDPGLRRELAERFRPTDDALAARLGRPLPWTSQADGR